MSSSSDEGRWHDAAVIRMIHQARNGNPAAVHDLVRFARIQPHYRLPEVTQALAEVLTASGTGETERTAIESLRGTFVYSAIEQEATIIRLTTRARLGDARAVYDLIEVAKSYGYIHHSKMIETLVDISVSKTAPREHRAAVESLRGHPVFERVAEVQRERALTNLIRAAKSGDHAALQDLVKLAESQTFLRDSRVAETLADVFLSDSANKAQRTLIWPLKDREVYLLVLEGEPGTISPYTGEEEGGTPTEYLHYTFWEYLQKYRGPQLEQWLASERARR